MPGEDIAAIVFKLLTVVVFSIKFKLITAATLGNGFLAAATDVIRSKTWF